MMGRKETGVAIIGGGLAGLRCAAVLQEAGVPYELFEAGDDFGGRVRTDQVDGFRLDRGFQVFLTAYPEAGRVLDLPALKLRRFHPAALIRRAGRFHLLADPWRRPWLAHRSLLAPTGGLLDKLRLARLRRRLLESDPVALLGRPARETHDHLRALGFSREIIDAFFRPFYGGVLLDPELRSSSRTFEFTFRMFARGDAAVPEEGMGAIPAQMVRRLAAGRLHPKTPVRAVAGREIVLEGGVRIAARAIVVATGARAAADLVPGVAPLAWRAVTALYFDAPAAPLRGPLLVLNGEGRGPINNCAVMSEVSPAYAPPGRALVSVSVLGLPEAGGEALVGRVRAQLRTWFGRRADAWNLLRVYEIPEALPDQSPAALDPVRLPSRLGEGLFACGDHRDLRSIEGALVSGRRAAEAVLADLRA